VFACPLRPGASRADALLPVVAVLLGGNAALLLPAPGCAELAREVRERLLAADLPGERVALLVRSDPAPLLRDADLDGVATSGDPELARLASRALASRPGAILPVVEAATPLDLPRFVHEKAISVNTAASGGNAALLAQGEPA
jgi:RHH-type proline utilization regulon transcriptional repressor/proline dehydrogenase/delta 1-pyrroline-5-carboxylate dehydrogenase